MSRRFAQVDVFGAEPYAGNPVAVVLDALREAGRDADSVKIDDLAGIDELP